MSAKSGESGTYRGEIRGIWLMQETIGEISGKMCIFASSINRSPNMLSKNIERRTYFHNEIVGFHFP